MNRRLFLKTGIALGAFPTLTHAQVLGGPRELMSEAPTTIGLIADLHHGLEPTAEKRLDAFMNEVDKNKPDSILQLGDFNFGEKSSQPCMKLWEQFKGKRHHVLGNHDMDKFGKKHMLDFWGMPGRYYSFDQGPIHFVILDRNHLRKENKFVAYEKANFYVDGRFRGFADDAQLEWLEADLKKTKKPTVVFAHQGLGMDDQKHPSNAAIEKVLADANRDRTKPKVIACFCGHHHIDRYNFKDQIHYVWINSASYYWVGGKYGRMAGYKDPLFCFLSFDSNGSIQLEGRRSEWVAPSPKERGVPDWEKLTTWISDRQLTAGEKESANKSGV